jgi:uncharacterized protein YjiK
MLAAVTFLAVIIGVRASNLDHHFHYAWQDLATTSGIKAESLWLPDYRADVDALPIDGISKNASGITYDHDSRSLWIVVNSPPALVELDLDFTIRRKIELRNFVDPEAVAWLGDGRFAIADERKRAVVMAVIDPGTRVIDRKNSRGVSVYSGGANNRGLEGIAVDPIQRRLFTVREQGPRQMYTVSGFIDGSEKPSVDRPIEFDLADLGLEDLSGLHFDVFTRHLLVLSDESRELAEVDLQGNRISSMVFETGLGGLATRIPQAEGVTLDDRGRLYIVSEPNLIYRFTTEILPHRRYALNSPAAH